jgi:hypothetical protein
VVPSKTTAVKTLPIVEGKSEELGSLRRQVKNVADGCHEENDDDESHGRAERLVAVRRGFEPGRFSTAKSTAKATDQMGSIARLGVWYAVEFASCG